MYDEIVSCRPVFTDSEPAADTTHSLQALTTNYYAHNVSAIEESWLSDIPGLSDSSIQSVKQSFEGKPDVVME